MGKKSFIGRKNESAYLKNAIEKRNKGILVYGPRQVGKTALIIDVLENQMQTKYIYYECVKGSFQYNVELFAKTCAEATGLEYIARMRDIFDIFDVLNESTSGKHIIVVIDEYPYMRSSLSKDTLDSYMQRIIDTSRNLSIIFSGSWMSVMKEMLEYDSPLFNRITATLEVRPFNYLESALFYPNLPTRDKIAFYSVFGGYPFALSMLDPKETLEENIARLLVKEGSPVRITLENILVRDVLKSDFPEEILVRIGNGKLKYNEIKDMMSEDVSGTLDRMLKRLIAMGIVTKTSPINRKDDKKKMFYEISDNLLRFFNTYIKKNNSLIRRVPEDVFVKELINPSLDTYISRRFENLCNEYFQLVSPIDVVDIGTYWYDDKRTRTNGEFDSALKLRNGTYMVFEAKYLKNKMDMTLYEKEKRKILEVKGLQVSGMGFISSSGFSFDTKNLPDRFISGEELYSIQNP